MVDDLFMAVSGSIAVTMVLAIAIGNMLVVRDTVRRRGRWGVNFQRVHCPRCSERAPVVRIPKNLQQCLWGGCTCGVCGLEYDKWGRAVSEVSVPDANEGW